MDSSINSRRTVALNVYQSSLLVALKLCSHALAVEVRNSTFLLDVVQNAILRVGDLVRRTPTSTVGRKHNCEQPLSSREIHFLVVYAFAWAFSERFCAYHGGRLAGKVVSSVLKTSALNMEGEITSCVPDAAQMLFSVVECESNRQLWDIKL